MRLLRDWILKNEMKKLWGQSIGTKVKYFWRKGWDEIPEILILLPLAFVGFGLALRTAYLSATDHRPPKYYYDITIFRPDDPRVATIRKDETLVPERPRTYF